jgi:hypothetical protein
MFDQNARVTFDAWHFGEVSLSEPIIAFSANPGGMA